MDKKTSDVTTRLKNPIFIAAAAALIYQVLQRYGIAPERADYNAAVDLITYIAIGAGIYSTFGQAPRPPEETQEEEE